MVSQLDTSSSLSHRGPSSVVSRPATSRKRLNRSYAGGSSYVPDNNFPVFSHTGDVEIVVRAGPAENRYLLHRDILVRCSGFFELSTSDQWSKARPLLAGGNELTRIGDDGMPTPSASAVDGEPAAATAAGGGPTPGLGRMRWRYELDHGTGDDDVPMLVQRHDGDEAPAGRRGAAKPPTPSPPSIFGPGPGAASATSSALSASHAPRAKAGHLHSASAVSHRDYSRSVSNLGLGSSHHHHHHHRRRPSAQGGPPPLSRAEHDLLRDYDNLFRTMYNYPPLLDGVNVADAYVQCKSLLNLADQYDALPVVGPRVDHHLLQFQSRLWRQIAKYPISYLRLGYLARSQVIFREALIHVVGQWPSGERSLRAVLPDAVLDIIEDKVDELEETVSRVEGRLFRLSLTTARGDRVTPSNAYLDWLALCLFRQWLADNTSPQQPPPQQQQQQQQQQPPAPLDHRSRSRARPAALPPAVPPLASVGRAYRTLGSASPSSYLGHDDCKRFLKLTPEMYTRDNLRRFERRMDELKAMARDLVRPLMGSELELDLVGSGRASSEGVAYLTCTAIGTRDLPWALDD